MTDGITEGLIRELRARPEVRTWLDVGALTMDTLAAHGPCSFDLVTCVDVLTEEAPEPAIGGMWACVRRGGALLVRVHGPADWWERKLSNVTGVRPRHAALVNGACTVFVLEKVAL